MLEKLCPASFRRYSSLRILGPIVDEFTIWLLKQRYTRASIRQRIWLLAYIDVTLMQRGVRHLNEIKPADLVSFRKSLRRRFPYLTGTTDALEGYLRTRNVLVPEVTAATSEAAAYLAAYAQYLRTVRGAAASTIQQNSYTASEFLAYMQVDKHCERLQSLT